MVAEVMCPFSIGGLHLDGTQLTLNSFRSSPPTQTCLVIPIQLGGQARRPGLCHTSSNLNVLDSVKESLWIRMLTLSLPTTAPSLALISYLFLFNNLSMDLGALRVHPRHNHGNAALSLKLLVDSRHAWDKLQHATPCGPGPADPPDIVLPGCVLHGRFAALSCLYSTVGRAQRVRCSLRP